jgi:hypothetical protein
VIRVRTRILIRDFTNMGKQGYPQGPEAFRDMLLSSLLFRSVT